MEIGFLEIRLLDLLDVTIVGFLIFQAYKLLRGSIAFNIFIGVVLLYIVWWLVGVLEMDLLKALLDQFVRVGVIVLIIIFQPEVRRFLLFLGNTTLRQRSSFLNRLLDPSRNKTTSTKAEDLANTLRKTLVKLGRQRTGVLLVLCGSNSVETIGDGGVWVDANTTGQLIESIFHKDSPIHDGAVLLQNGRLKYASRILPVSNSNKLPQKVGLRHRAAVGVTEGSDVVAIIVSEETGKISFAIKGELELDVTEKQLVHFLNTYLGA